MVYIFISMSELVIHGSNALHPALKSVCGNFIVLWNIFSFVKTQVPDTDLHFVFTKYIYLTDHLEDNSVFYPRVRAYCVIHCRPLMELDD